ncbi:hypothetical protein SEA_REYNAULD_10 [Rhodococcus phage Reynauld]|uniref:Uncharacterized protein n=1 Tax=Rhodococcus phage Reynauld TaxID=3062845 RepID=A0ACD4UHE9_9CAUD|nr:hypothetical protein SEA_REYNAULD_10 [Rhodococcus phage Reynauld]
MALTLHRVSITQHATYGNGIGYDLDFELSAPKPVSGPKVRPGIERPCPSPRIGDQTVEVAAVTCYSPDLAVMVARDLVQVERRMHLDAAAHLERVMRRPAAAAGEGGVA